jgi:fatty-acyl-CoA synthase
MIVPLSVLEFRDHAEAHFRDKVGVIDGDRTFTYGQFAERTRRLANAIRGLGVRRGDRVAFVTYNTHQILEAYYGVVQAGAILTPINIRLRPEDIAYILNHSASRILFFHRDFLPLVQSVREALSATEHLVVMEGELEEPATHEYEGLLAASAPDVPEPEIDENDVAELFYTSGTTGTPKGVALTHRSLYLHAFSSLLAIPATDADVLLHVVPLFHINGWGSPHTATIAGATHVMMRRFDPAAVLEAIERHRVTCLFGVPLIFNALLNHPELARFDLSSLRRLVAGGAPSSPALIRAMQDRLVPNGLASVGYGLSETSPVVSVARPRAHLAAAEGPERTLRRQATAGWPAPGVRVRVVDSRGDDVRHDGRQIGEILVRSNVVMDGYYRDAEATRAAIRDGWLRTGDMATIAEDGEISIQDRAKDIIISGGENISSVEIENVLYAHPDVLECAVVSCPDEKWGEAPYAFLVPKPGASPSFEDLLAHCRKQLAGFKVPRQFDLRRQLPKGGTGKILKGELRESLWKGKPRRVQ